MLSLRVRPLVLFVLALLPLTNCTCNNTAPCAQVAGNQSDHPSTCAASSECGDHHGCQPSPNDQSQQCCLFVDRGCTTEADCCPGQTCPADKHTCFDRVLECQTDADCGDQGDRFCTTYTDTYGTSKRCRTKACGANNSCPNGQSCFEGVCLAGLPCDGSCPSGSACVVDTNKCQAYACPATCQAGFIAAFHDQTNIWDACNKPQVSCECVSLPSLKSTDLGRHSAVATDAPHGTVVASEYDGQFGDLVVNHYDSTGNLTKSEYVDGVPAGGVASFSPTGPRGGITDPGDDVGRFTDVAVGPSGDAYVSYYDATHGDLKFAYQPTGGSWTTLTVDGANADLGLYTSVAVDGTGLPAVAYFQRGGDAGFSASSCPAPAPTGPVGYITALKLARATKAHPGPTDWNIQTLACMSRPAPPCTGCADTCADPGSGPACYTASSACTTACDPNTEACVSVSGTPTCGKKYNPSQVQGLEDGVGLFVSLTFKGSDAYLAYMKRQSSKGSLYGLHVSPSGVADVPFLVDGSGDVGYFPDLKVSPSGNLALTYQDMGHHSLQYFTGTAFNASGTHETIDDGVGAPGTGDVDIVGADSAIAFSSSGTIYVAYQDSTAGDLALAARTTSWKRLPPLHTTGAVGFFADAATIGNTLFVSHAMLHAHTVNGTPMLDNQLLLDRTGMQ